MESPANQPASKAEPQEENDVRFRNNVQALGLPLASFLGLFMQFVVGTTRQLMIE
jgi:hypothetical protein